MEGAKEGAVLLGLFLIAVILVVSGFEGSIGSVWAVIFTPDALVIAPGNG